MALPFGERLSAVFISYILKVPAEHIEYAGCVVNQKLIYFYTCSDACMFGMKACMHVAHVFQKLNI